jgi:TolB-like protein
MKALERDVVPKDSPFSIAVFPIENLSGTVAPLKLIRQLLIQRLKARGFQVLSEEALEAFIVRNRIRSTSGIDDTTARALKNETGVEGVLITSLEFYSEAAPPKVALTSRLVSTGGTPLILWIDGVGLAGDDAPGVLGLGLIDDPDLLLNKALETLTMSLEEHLYRKAEKEGIEKANKKYRPRIAYRSSVWDTGKKQTVAVIPFFNQSERKNAGDFIVLQFIKTLKKLEAFDVVEPGLIRKVFLGLRIIMMEGVSLNEANALFGALDADLVLTGKVFDYQDYQGIFGKPKIRFSAQLVDRKTQQVVWSSVSRNEGDDGVIFFDWGRVNTAHAMASQMVLSIGNMMVQR